MADLQDMCEELQSMQATMTEQATESGKQVRFVTRLQQFAPFRSCFTYSNAETCASYLLADC